jgi:esterase
MALNVDQLRRTAEVAGIQVGELVAPSSENVVANGTRLHYLNWGGDDLPAAVFLHGGGLTAHTWDLVCLALSTHVRCIAIDLRGHGDSEWSPDGRYGLADFVADVWSFLRVAQLESAVLVGQSLGAFVGLSLAAHDSARPAGLVMIDVHPEIPPDSAELRRIRDFMSGPAELDSIDEFVERAVRFNPRRSERLLRQSIQHSLRQTQDGRWTWKYDPRHRSTEQFERLRRDFGTLTAALPRVSCPVMIVRGAESGVLSDDRAAQLAACFADGSWATVRQAGHNVQGDNPAGLVEAVAPFVTRVAPLRNLARTTPP